MNKRILLLLLLCIVTRSFAQKARVKEDYLNVIKQFYSALLSENTVTLNEYKGFFDWEVVT